MLYKNQIFYMADAVDYLTTDIDLKKVANAIRGRTGKTAAISYPDGYVSEISKLSDTSTDTVTPDKLISGTTAHDKSGNAITGTMPAVEQAVPSISVSQDGLITASVQQGAGYVAAGTKSATMQLPTYDGSVS